MSVRIGQSFFDDSHPEEPSFTIIATPEDERIVELDNSQWYELDGPEGLLAKIASGVVYEIGA